MANTARSNAMRTATGGRLLDRGAPVRFTFNGKSLEGYRGDTLASALIASGQRMVGRSFKYHRPRGFVASGVEEPNGLFGTGDGPRFEPNQRGTMVELFDGLTARSQNHFPTLERDIGSLNAMASRLFPAGFYYKTFLRPRAAWKHVFEPIIRQAAGLGKAPTEADVDEYEHIYLRCDVLIAGGGIAGVMAAKAAAASGARVVLTEQSPALGGRALVDEATVDGGPLADWIEREIAALERAPNVAVLTRCQTAAIEDHNYALLYERVTDHRPAGAEGAPRHRLWRVRAGQIIVAAGAIERPIAFAENDTPGVMLASAVRDYLGLYGAKCGDRVVLFTNNDDAYRTAIALREAGVEVPAILDARDGSNGDLPQATRALGVRTLFGATVNKALGGKALEGVEVAELRPSGRIGGVETLECDCLAMSGGWNPAAHLWSHAGGKLAWDDALTAFRPNAETAPIRWDGASAAIVCGAANGVFDTQAALADGLAAGAEAARREGFRGEAPPAPEVETAREDRIEPLWFAPSTGKYAIGSKHFIDFQNDVTAADVELAAREGYESVEHLKRYTTLGMATDQGKLSNVNGLAILADARKAPIPAVGTTTFRPPYTPISFGSIAGDAANDLFKPIRRTAMHAWHEARGAEWEPVGEWRRPYCYPQAKEAGREDAGEAINREIRAVRDRVGALDASTLGKIVVSGPDAGVFLDRLYTNMISTLKPGRCRYALMLNDNGFLVDDGVVVRLDDGSGPSPTFLCHTTSGGADRTHAGMEEWLQTEWTDLRVFTTNVTEQFSQIALAGPKARAVLEALAGPDLDLSPEGLPFMSWTAGTLAGCPVRVFRISFSGELSFELATPAGYGLALWEALMAAGAAHGIEPYGTEALHVLRAEKGFIVIGDETDGTVTPHDVGLSWAVSKKKTDFIGRRALQRPFLRAPDRKRLVGLLTETPDEVLPDGAHAVDGKREDGRPRAIGHVTSSYWSPTLQRSIAMALIRGGMDREGQTIDVSVAAGRTLRAKVVNPVFYDPENARQAS